MIFGFPREAEGKGLSYAEARESVAYLSELGGGR